MGGRVNVREKFFGEVYIGWEMLWICLVMVGFRGRGDLNDIFDLS